MIFNMRAREVLGVIESDSTDLMGSYDSTLKINKIGGVCVQGENPSPTNPQEIKKSVVSEVKTHGKNLWSGGDVSGVTAYEGQQVFSVANIAGVSLNDEITISFNPNGYVGEINFLSAVGSGYVNSDGVSRIKQNFSLLSLSGNLFYLSVAKDVSYNFTEVQVEYGSAMTDYEPYTESTIALSNPIDLYGIGDVQDVIEDSKVKRKFAEVVFDGSDDEAWKASSSLAGRYYLDNVGCVHHGKLLCTHAEGVSKSVAIVNQCFLDTNRLLINTEFTTLAEWKAHLQSNPMTVVYELTTPVTEELPLTDQLALSWLKTFHGVTYVKFDSEVQATLNSEYATNLEGAITLQAHADNKIGKANTLVNRAEDETQNFEVRVEHGLVYLYKDDVLHGIVGANNVTTNNQTYKTMNVRAESDADFIALTNKKTNTVCYYMNINKVPFTQNNYTEPHYFGGDMRLVGNLKATGGVWSEETHVKKMGVNGGVAQAVEWVWDSVLERWVLCTVNE